TTVAPVIKGKYISKAAISKDIVVTANNLPLITGATVVLATRDIAIDADRLSQIIVENNITIMQATPATWRMLLDNNWQGKPDLKILCGGEALPENLAAELDSCCQEVYNLYGPTETTIWSSVHKYSQGNSSTVSIGKAIANTQFYILDSYLNLVPKGIPGELYIGGAGLARGYLHRGDLTAERFIPNPFSLNIEHLTFNNHQLPVTLYKTGDRVRQLPDNSLEYLGRLDNQVKIRGFRIELGEIEAVLTQNAVVKNAVVIPHKENLIAYVVLSKGALKDSLRIAEEQEGSPKGLAPKVASGAGELRQSLTERLPSYMIPSNIIELESFPLTPNGKIDRKALPLPDVVEDSSNETIILPQNKTEEILLGIWQEVLNRNSISIDANFFELGGHSLLVTRVISQVREAFTIELPLRSLFEHPTIRDLGRVIDSEQSNSTKNPFDIEIVDRESELPLSFAQQRQWFLHQLEPDNPAYNISTAVKVTGSLDIDKLQQCLNILVKRQEILQTAFLTVEGKPQLQINPDTVINLQAIDLRELSEEEKEEEIQQLKTADARQPFQLDTSPLMRVKLLQIEREENILLLSVHHIIADGWSLGVLVKEIVGLYQEAGEQ
ncbi:MAG: condensation domain-containing protein, partial [Cyanobacteria bacterium P01_C01_bin.72]